MLARIRRGRWFFVVAAVAVVSAAWAARTGDEPVATDSPSAELQPGPARLAGSGPQIPGASGAGGQAGNAIIGQAGRLSVLVHFDPLLTRSSVRRTDVRTFATQRGGFVGHVYGQVLPNVLNLRDIPEADLEALKKMPGVVKVEKDRMVRAHLHNSTPLINGLQSQITGAGFSADGSGTRICILDTGIDSDHTMYSTRIDTAAGWDFVNNDSNPEDDNGHGSHVSGIAAGGAGSVDFACPGPVPFQGVAPNATLIGVKVLDAGGGGALSNVIAGIDRCASATLPGGPADVINLSLGAGAFGTACDTDTLALAANNAVASGVVVVASAGNEGNANAMGTPACASSVIAVGGTYDDSFPNCENPTTPSFTWCLDQFCFTTCTDNTPATDSLICFSNQSDNLDVAAPGCISHSASTAAGGAQITDQCGTSQASPHVAGLAALLLGVDPTQTPAEVRQVIRDGAVDMGPAGFDRGYGFGRIDVIGSLQLVAAPGCTVNADCDDGLFCNGAESCDLALGCQAGADPCPGQSCDEAGDFCFTTPACNTNGVCDPGEDCNSCAADCVSGTALPPSCGNGVCEPFNRENCKRCPQDCAGTKDGPFCCGNGEDGANPVGCADMRCTTGGFMCSDAPVPGSCCGDLLCEGIESSANCAVDCGAPPFCGDATCDPGEDSCSCSQDCGAPPVTETNCTDGVDNDCDGFTDCIDANCSADPACAAPFCGDATCDLGEDPCSCSQDCGAPPVTEISCTDGVDNDCDGLMDCADADCSADPACAQTCLPDGAACSVDAECCRNRCRLKDGNQVCD